MNLLLDTHVLIWWMEKSSRLGTRMRKALLSDTTRPVVSSVSIWEMSIKAAIGRLEMVDPLETWLPRLANDWGVLSLPITLITQRPLEDCHRTTMILSTGCWWLKHNPRT